MSSLIEVPSRNSAMASFSWSLSFYSKRMPISDSVRSCFLWLYMKCTRSGQQRLYCSICIVNDQLLWLSWHSTFQLLIGQFGQQHCGVESPLRFRINSLYAHFWGYGCHKLLIFGFTHWKWGLWQNSLNNVTIFGITNLISRSLGQVASKNSLLWWRMPGILDFRRVGRWNLWCEHTCCPAIDSEIVRQLNKIIWRHNLSKSYLSSLPTCIVAAVLIYKYRLISSFSLQRHAPHVCQANKFRLSKSYSAFLWHCSNLNIFDQKELTREFHGITSSIKYWNIDRQIVSTGLLNS